MTRRDVDTVVVVGLYKQGVIPADIARMFNCSGAMIRDRLKRVGVYVKKPTPKKAEHGTRTMYVHHGCRCEACCRAEHEQYLKRPEVKLRRRTNSKHGDKQPIKSKSKQGAERWSALRNREHDCQKPIHWKQLTKRFGMNCAICGCETDPNDFWIDNNGRKCFGRSYPTVDHIVPLKLGGTDTFDNVQLACKRCNSKKGSRLEVFA